MIVKFKNAEVPIYKLRKGAIVEFDGDYFHIQNVYNTVDQLLKVRIKGRYTKFELLPKFITWLEV